VLPWKRTLARSLRKLPRAGELLKQRCAGVSAVRRLSRLISVTLGPVARCRRDRCAARGMRRSRATPGSPRSFNDRALKAGEGFQSTGTPRLPPSVLTGRNSADWGGTPGRRCARPGTARHGLLAPRRDAVEPLDEVAGDLFAVQFVEDLVPSLGIESLLDPRKACLRKVVKQPPEAPQILVYGIPRP
jgi:hypothetical protein